MPDAERLHRTAGAIALAVGVSSALSPTTFLRPFGIAPAAVTAPATMGWRMFGVRTALIGGAVVAGDDRARAIVIPVQLADQVAFGLAGREADMPRRAVRLAQATSLVLIGLSAAAHAAASS